MSLTSYQAAPSRIKFFLFGTLSFRQCAYFNPFLQDCKWLIADYAFFFAGNGVKMRFWRQLPTQKMPAPPHTTTGGFTGRHLIAILLGVAGLQLPQLPGSGDRAKGVGNGENRHGP